MEQSADYIILENTSQQRQGVIDLAGQASRNLQILSDALEPAFFNQTEFIEICKQLVLRHPSCFIKLLVKDTEKLRHMEHRLIDLMNRLPSRIEMKICHEEDREVPEVWMTSDNNGLFIKSKPGRTPVRLFQNTPRLNNDYQRRFAKMWDRAEPASLLRRLAL